MGYVAWLETLLTPEYGCRGSQCVYAANNSPFEFSGDLCEVRASDKYLTTWMYIFKFVSNLSSANAVVSRCSANGISKCFMGRTRKKCLKAFEHFHERSRVFHASHLYIVHTSDWFDDRIGEIRYDSQAVMARLITTIRLWQQQVSQIHFASIITIRSLPS